MHTIAIVASDRNSPSVSKSHSSLSSAL